MHKKKPHVCFVSLTAYSMISGDRNIRIVGGAELQQSLLAKALTKKGYQVSMICMDHGQNDNLEIDGVKIIKAYQPSAGFPVFRFLYPRLSSVWKGMKKANADIYFQCAAGMLTGVVAAYCKFNNKKSIFYAASDADFRKMPTHIKYRRDLWLYQYGVKHVDKVLTQNSNQYCQCKMMYQRDSIKVPNIYAQPEFASNSANGYILWVSTIRQLKRPELFVKLAKSFPQYQFKMVGGIGLGDETLYENINTQAATCANLDFVGFVPYALIDSYFDEARLVINTSDFEGFPNAFLQAWARMIPTVSFFDCGARFDDKPVGLLASSFEEMGQLVEKLMTNDNEWVFHGQRCKTYFDANHSMEHAVAAYEEVFLKMLEEK